MSNHFTKAAVFGDIHFGEKSDSEQHNKDCLDYIDWMLEQAHQHEVDRVIFLGDWFHNQSRIRTDTLHYGNEGLKRIAQLYPVDMLVGNHDMFHLHSRTINSVDHYDQWEHVTVHNNPTTIDGVGFVPFLVGSEYLEVLEMDVKYLFGHFELPNFLLNNLRRSDDHGPLKSDSFSMPSGVFTGHFHKRQLQVNSKNVPTWYIGSPFGHNFNDSDDPERGMMILEWDKPPVFLDWEEGPLYQRFAMSHVVKMLEDGTFESRVRKRSILEIKDDLGLELEDIGGIRDVLLEFVREVRIPPSSMTPDVSTGEVDDNLSDAPLPDIVEEQLRAVDARDSDIDPQLLIKLFRGEYTR